MVAMEVKIKRLDGDVKIMKVDDGMLVSKLVEELSEKIGVEKSQLKLMFQARSMESTSTLRELEVKNNSMLHMILLLHGG